MLNRYAGPCTECGGRVPAKGGELFKDGTKWRVRHLACANGPEVVSYYFAATGNSGTINRRGRCEDAPCCGCCTL